VEGGAKEGKDEKQVEGQKKGNKEKGKGKDIAVSIFSHSSCPIN
jgi:hypothetical protein